MIILIAESKTMSPVENEVSTADLSQHLPQFEAEADSIIQFLRPMDIAELSERLKISAQLATKAKKFIYEFPNKTTGREAIDAFTGEVFKAMDVPTFTDTMRASAISSVQIVSSLYGLLRSNDIIKPYRLDFNVDCNPDGGSLSKYWKSKLTIALVKYLKENSEKEILNLMPGDASSCFDWKLIKAFARVEKPDFKVIGPDGKLKTPHSGRLKELRGIMIRQILSDGVSTLDGVLQLDTAEFSHNNEAYKRGLPSL